MATKSDKKSPNKKLQEKLTYKQESAWNQISEAQRKEVFKFNEDYKKFIANSKTERMCAKNVISHLEKNGFKNIAKASKPKKYEKYYKVFKEKAVFAFVLGDDPTSMQLIGSHMDSPRLDFKPKPFYQDSDVALMKTHYYGGVKKYQWANVPLAIHGVAHTKGGKRIEVHIGEDEADPVMIIPDILPHLGRKIQKSRQGDEIIEGEELNILIGSVPVNDKEITDQVKFTALKYLYDTYGLVEEDLVVSELQLVPALKPRDIGFDRGLLAAYGQDDKVCVYTSLRALLDVKKPKHTAVGMFVDKEEIGSMGNSGAASLILMNFAKDYVNLLNLKVSAEKVLENTRSISADVTAAMNPNFSSVNDPRNVAYVGRGVGLKKYGGAGGKYSTNDAHAEYMSYLRELFRKNNVIWQTGELGKIDIGGGGTIAMYMSRYGMDCVDMGPAVLAMHAPLEVSSKVDVFMAYKGYKVFFND